MHRRHGRRCGELRGVRRWNRFRELGCRVDHGSRTAQLGYVVAQEYKDYRRVERTVPGGILQHLEPPSVQSTGEQCRCELGSNQQQLRSAARRAVRVEVPVLGAGASNQAPSSRERRWGFLFFGDRFTVCRAVAVREAGRSKQRPYKELRGTDRRAVEQNRSLTAEADSG